MELESATLPLLPHRISGEQLTVLIADLKPLVCSSLTISMRFDSFPNPPRLSPAREFKACDDRLVHLWRRLNARVRPPEQRRYRLRVDLFEATVCTAALRTALRQRPTDPPSQIPKTPEAKRRRSQLLKGLENLRRRLDRRFNTKVGQLTGAEFARLLASYRKVILEELFHRLPAWCHASGLRHVYQTVVNSVVRLAVAGLHKAGVDNPDVDVVRRLVRTYLAYTRRGRTGFGIPDFSRNPDFAEKRLASFIQHRWAKRNSKPPTVVQKGLPREQTL